MNRHEDQKWCSTRYLFHKKGDLTAENWPLIWKPHAIQLKGLINIDINFIPDCQCCPNALEILTWSENIYIFRHLKLISRIQQVSVILKNRQMHHPSKFGELVTSTNLDMGPASKCIIFFVQKTLYAKLILMTRTESECKWVRRIKIVSYVKTENKNDMPGSLLCVL